MPLAGWGQGQQRFAQKGLHPQRLSRQSDQLAKNRALWIGLESANRLRWPTRSEHPVTGNICKKILTKMLSILRQKAKKIASNCLLAIIN